MSFIKIQHVVSVSSEDKSYPAENLLKTGEYKKWLCAKGGQKQSSVVLQLEKASKIQGLDIGNDGSAFVEVLVGRLSDGEQNYQVLLVASSFMSPMESRNNTNTNRVRMFDSDKFTQVVKDEKWDRVKVVCTQPFNKTAQYGLAFVRFHSSESIQIGSSKDSTSQSKRMGAFTLKEDSNEPALAPGSLFNKVKESGSAPSSLKGVLDIRAASAKAESELFKPASSTKPSATNVASKRKAATKDETEPDAKKAAISMTKAAPPYPPSKASPPAKTPPTVKKDQSNMPSPTRSKGEFDVSTSSVPFQKLLSGVVFALSGFQNPHRGELRDKALDMGAKYKTDWCDGCTHLICAFPNTPKFQQVKSAHGNIVTKQWILDCHKRKAALPWRNYKLKAQDANSSSDSDGDTSQATKQSSKTPSRKDESSKNKGNQMPKGKDSKENKSDCPDDEYGGSTDVESSPCAGKGDCETDTDDEIRRTIEDRNKERVSLSPLPDTSDLPLPELPDYFRGSGFFFYGDFDQEERRRLLRYIIAFNGKVENYMNEKVAYVITTSDWDYNFDEALTSNESLIFAKPKWIHMCAAKRKVVPHQPYVIVPTA